MWEHGRQAIGEVLCEKYQGVLDTGRRPEKAEIELEVAAATYGKFQYGFRLP